MSPRQSLKKKIYQYQQDGIDTSDLEKKLNELSDAPEVKLAHAEQEISEIYKIIEANDFSSFVIDKYMDKLNELEKNIRKLKQEIQGVEIKNDNIPYLIKKIIKERVFFYDKYLEIIESITSKNGKNISLVENDLKSRYIVLNIDGQKFRFNLLTKKEFVNDNFYLLSKKTSPFTGRKIKINYTNVLKYINKEG